MEYEVVMGLEVHVELATETKLFCGCSAKFGAEPNENVCPACAGMPGMPAVVNKKAVELGIRAALVTNSKIAPVMTFDKKNYFYPDLSTGYQITQFYAPICKDGYVEIETAKGLKKITLKQIHIEEDAGKLVHDAGVSLVDFNRASVPLIEIVSNPDFRSAEEVIAYLEKLRSILSFAGVSGCKMQEGSMRCDVNISVREKGSDKLGVRAEIKNMNSLKSITAAIAYESERQIDAIETGGEVLIQETRGWDEHKGETYSMRGKEDATDYRYFPNPELMPVLIDDSWIDKVRASLPELSHEKFKRLTETLDVSAYTAKILTGSKGLSDIFDETVKYFNNPKEVANWIVVELLAVATGNNKGADDIVIDCEKFASLMRLASENTINRATAKTILPLILEKGVDPVEYVEKNNLGMVADKEVVLAAVKAVVLENAKSVDEYKAGNQKVLGFLVGQTIKKLGKNANPQMINSLLLEILKK